MDDREEQLSWERRVGRPVAIASFAVAALLIAALVYSNSVLGVQEGDTLERLRDLRGNEGEWLTAVSIFALSTALLAVPLWFLYEAVAFRRPETPRVARYLALVGPPLSGALAVIHQIQENAAADRVHKALQENPLSHENALELARDEVASGTLLGSLALAAALALAFALILISLNAMRAGLLSRFMGILGIIVGVTTVIPLLGPVPIVEVFWVAALGLLFLGKWPQGGRGPAWDTGEAIPWPTAADRQAELVAARAEREEEEDESDPASRAAAATNGRGDDPHARQHPRSKKRKRKRR